MANNQVNVFAKKPPSKYSWVAEIRSQAEQSNRPPQLFYMQMKADQKSNAGLNMTKENQAIYCTIPLIRESIPLVILFRALNCVADKLIMNRICFDCSDDPQMREALRPSLEEAKIIETQEDALDYIAKRGIA